MHRIKVAVLSLMAIASTAASASYPQLTANNDYVSVEIRAGTDGQSAEQMSVVRQGRMSKGEKHPGQEGQRLCGRREAMPGSSGGGWSGWYCASSFKGVQVGQPSNTNF